MTDDHQTTLTELASFPAHDFLANLAVRSDNSLLVTVANRREIWYVPPSASPAESVTPLLLATPMEATTGIAEAEPDVFSICTSRNLNKEGGSYLLRLELRGWPPGEGVHLEQLHVFDPSVRELNGACLIAPGVLLAADCFSSKIWRLDSTGDEINASLWPSDGSMDHKPGGSMPDQPGVNGLGYAPRTGFLHDMSTAQKLFMRVAVDATTYGPVGPPEFVSGGVMADDSCIDEDAAVAYLTTHRENTVARVSLDPGKNTGERHRVADDPFTEQLIGPSSLAWGRLPGEYGRFAIRPFSARRVPRTHGRFRSYWANHARGGSSPLLDVLLSQSTPEA
jgi:hypothetical protein